jgi:hypothetical protein
VRVPRHCPGVDRGLEHHQGRLHHQPHGAEGSIGARRAGVTAAAHRPGAAHPCELGSGGAEVFRGHDVPVPAREVAGLLVTGRTDLFMVQGILLPHQSQLPVRLAVAGSIIGQAIGDVAGGPGGARPVAGGKGAEILRQLRLLDLADGEPANGGVGRDVAVELTHPVDPPVGPGVVNEHVQAAAAVQGVLAPAAVDDFVGRMDKPGFSLTIIVEGLKRRQIEDLLQLVGHVDDGLLDVARRGD